MNVLVFVFDRLHAGYLGPYGNAWIQTPAFNRLACQSFLFDQALIDSPQLDDLYRSYWRGWHPLCPKGPPADRPSLIAALNRSGLKTTLLSDEPQISRHPGAEEFEELIALDPPWRIETAEDAERTHLARCFEEIIERLDDVTGESFFLWCHLGGLGATWDAPLSWRRTYQDEDDPDVPTSAQVPERWLPEDYDPDDVLGVTQSYAGQISLLDSCLDAFLEFFDKQPAARETLLALTSARGFPLGEHRRIGPCDEALYGELVHVPLFLRFPDALGAACRSSVLTEPSDLWATLWQWCQLGPLPHSPTAADLLPVVRGEVDPLRDRLALRGLNQDRAIRTPAWFLRNVGEGELYAKPDDRWEVNNVASRCQEVVECLQDALVLYEQTLYSGRISELPPLGDVLVQGLG
ncbi:MAG: sulfatase-like hydrolase/transferase [Pirellulales bacterium]|nr:sulfatase-like hydrolase/transferase [Pirellulales bacterium]